MKNILKVSILWLFLALNQAAIAQINSIHGMVLDAQNNESLIGVLVYNDKLTTYTDKHGYFTVTGDSMMFFLGFKLMGYRDTIIAISSDTDKLLKIFLEHDSYLLNTSVITASRTGKPLSESSISMSVIKADLPEKLNSNQVSEILDHVPGVQVIDGQANIRGGSGYSYGAGSRVLLMMDGLPALVSDSGFPNWDDLPLENISQIEIVKGAASALYGSSAMNGIIHFRSAYPEAEPYTTINVSGKYFMKPSSKKEWWGKNGDHSIPHALNLNFVHRRKIQQMDYSVSGQYYKKLGYNKDEDMETGRLHLLLRKRLNDKWKVSLGLNFNQGKSSSFFYWKDNGLFEGAANSASTTKKLRFTIDPTISYTSANNFQHSMLLRYFYVDNQSQNNQSNRSNSVYAEYQLIKYIPSISLQCIGGLVLNQSWTQAALYSDTSFYHRNAAGYIQLEKKFFSRLILSTGLRLENYYIKGPNIAGGRMIESTDNQDTSIFRFGLNYRLAKASFLRASYGQGFRFPTIAEKFISTQAGGLTVIPNPSLTAEYGYSWEIGIKQALQLRRTNLLVDVAYFQSRYFDMMEFILNNQFQFQSKNIGDTDIKGFEIEMQSSTEWPIWKINMSGGYTYIDPKYLEFDILGKQLPINKREEASRAQQNAANSSSFNNILKYRSKHLFRYDFQLDYKNIYLGLNFTYASHVDAVDWLFELDLFLKGIKDYRMNHANGYRVYDFRLGYYFRHGEFQFNIHNAFNEDYTERPGLMEAPRNLDLRFTYKF